MAGGSQMGGDSNDNPVPLNVTAMVDIIFCLCIFFMCSFKVKAIEGRMDSWLPKNTGMLTNAPPSNDEPLRIILIREAGNPKTLRFIEKRPIESIEQLQSLVRDAKADRRGDKLNVAIDAGTKVPWEDVVDVVNVCRNEKADNIEFVFGAVELDKELGGQGP
ncbi:MAG: biopolymer transporter ExbD [Planctomycetota bacterium]